MKTRIIEVTNNDQNWGKFMVMKPDTEWGRRSKIDPDLQMSLLRYCGWGPEHVWVLDLQTGEGACFAPHGMASADLNKHKVWVCPMFEPFLAWLYQQDLSDLDALPELLNLPDAPFAMSGYRRNMSGYRRKGPGHAKA
jgi:hypothetical protein